MDTPPIQSPPKEQAHYAIGGYLYQSWLAVEAWLTLKENELMFVECAEDFAQFSKDGEAKVTQVKNTTARITLRSSSAIEALNHYWALADAGVKKIKYCYVTTSQIGREKGNPIGDVDALKLWRQTAQNRDKVNAERIQSFLVNDASIQKQLDADLLSFLGAASVEEFINSVLCNIYWEDCHHDTEESRASVEEQLAIYAEKVFNATRVHSRNFADALISHVITVSAQVEKIPLTKNTLNATLARCYEATAISKSNAIRNSELSSVFTGATSDIVESGHISDLVPPWEISSDYSNREDAIEKIQEEIGDGGILLITGSSGMGKSTLAQIMSKSVEADWLTLSVRHAEALRAVRGIQECIWIIRQSARGVALIIDDLPWDEMDAGAINLLRVLSRISRAKQAHLIFTNQVAPSPTQLSGSGLSDIKVVAAPPMSVDEIKELCIKHKCDNGPRAAIWAKILNMHTSGHPQLVHASVLGLKNKDWPELSHEEYVKLVGVVDEARNHSQRLLSERTENEIELLTRLCGFVGNFNRQQALELANKLESISAASVSFNMLLGPWIEQVGSERYKVSPLIGKSLLQQSAESRQQLIHTAIAESILGCSPVDAGDASDALFNAILGNADRIATGIIVRFTQTEHKDEKQMHTCMSWIAHVDYGKYPIFQKWPELKHMLKTLEFRVCTTFAPRRCEKILDECYAWIESAESKETKQLRQGMLSHAILVSTESNVDLKHVFWAFDALKETQKEMLAEISEGTYTEASDNNELLPDSKWSDDNGLCVVIWPRVTRLEDIGSILTWLTSLSESHRKDYLAQLMSMKAMALSALDQIWQNEDKKAKDEQDWAPILKVYADLFDAAIHWDCHALAACAARAISIINNEYLNDTESATNILSGIDQSEPEVRSIISELHGKIELDRKNYDVALAHFENALNSNPWNEFSNASTLNLHHNAGVSAGYAENWEASYQHFIIAEEIATEDKNFTRAAAFATDAAYPLWMMGEYQEAINKFAQALQFCERSTSNGLLDLKVQKILGNNLMRLAYLKNRALREDQELTTPIMPGMCSNLNTHEELKKLPKPMLDFAWVFLLLIEFEYTDASNYWNLKLNLLKSTHLVLRREMWSLHNRRMIREKQYGDLLKFVVQEAIAAQLSREIREGIESTAWHADLDAEPQSSFGVDECYPIPLFLVWGLTSASINGQSTEDILASWRQESKSEPKVIGLVEIIDRIEEILSYGENEAFRLACKNEAIWSGLTAALRILKMEKPHPISLLAATVICTLHHDYRGGHYEFLSDAINVLDYKLSEKWKQACQTRALFRSPTLFMPDIHDLACNPDGTVSHIAKLALAAAPTQDLKLPTETYQDLRSIT